MNDEAGSADHAAIERLNADFRYYLDHGDAKSFSALFTEDAYYSNGAREARGREAIAAFIIARSAAGPRTTRHLYSGLRVDFVEPDCARATSVWLSFAFNGVPPAPMAEPFLVADMEDVYRRVTGRWLIAERRITPVFRNPRIPPPGGTP